MFPDLSVLKSFGERVSLVELSQLIEFFESVEDAVWPEDDEPLGFASVTYLDRFRRRLADSGKFDDTELGLIMRHARGYAGGMASAEAKKRRKDDDEDSLAASEGYFQHDGVVDLQPVIASEANMPWVQITPRAGATFKHPRYGNVAFTQETAREMVKNFDAKVYQEHIPVDAEHATKLSGALGYYRSLRVRTDGAVEARIELSDRGKQLRSEGGFRYFSPEFFQAWTDPASGTVHKNVLVGGAFTTRPYFKDKHLAPLAASEVQIWTVKKESVRMGEQWKKDDEGVLVLDADGNPQMTDEATAEAKTEAEKTSTEASEAAVTKFRDDHKIDEDGKPIDPDKKDDDDDAKKFAEQYPEQAAQMAEQATQMTKLAETNASLKLDAETQKFTDVVLGRSGEADGARPWAGETEKHVVHLLSLSEKFGDESDEIKHYVNMNREHAEQIAASSLFSETGSNAPVEASDAEGRVEAKVVEHMKANPDMTHAEATDAVLEANPEMYNEANAQQAAS